MFDICAVTRLAWLSRRAGLTAGSGRRKTPACTQVEHMSTSAAARSPLLCSGAG